MKKIMFNETHGLQRAAIAGTKTMTRRHCKDSATGEIILAKDVESVRLYQDPIAEFVMTNGDVRCSVPQYQIGEVVAIAQSYKEIYPYADFKMVGDELMTETAGWNNKMFVKADLMPHRIRITDIKVERLQDISDEDCLLDGIKKHGFMTYHWVTIKTLYEKSYRTPREAFAALIDKVSGRGTWERNPWVFAYSFELVK